MDLRRVLFRRRYHQPAQLFRRGRRRLGESPNCLLNRGAAQLIHPRPERGGPQPPERRACGHAGGGRGLLHAQAGREMAGE